MKKIKLSDNELKVLKVLEKDFDYQGLETRYWAFSGLSKVTRLNRRQVRLACRSLARKGFAEFVKGLMDLDGKPAGAGYGATKKGAAYLFPCDKCDDYALYDWHEDKNGEWCLSRNSVAHFRFCAKHYREYKESLKLL